MINSFSKFLVEEEKVVYFTFGRMNPPTIGHEKLLDKLASTARSSSYRVYLSQSQDSKKNPLQYAEKVKIARKMFPRHARSIMLNKKLKNVFDVLTSLYDEGYMNVVMVVGSDRVNEFEILMNKYNGKKGKHGFYNFRKINVISAGERDPDAEGVEGMSASKMRAAATSGDFSQFAQGLPKKVSNADAKKVFNAVRKGLGLKEEKEFKNHVQLEPVSDLRESYVNGELFKVGDQVVMKENGEIGTVKRLGSNYVIIEGSGNQYRKWLDSVEKVDEKQPEYETASFSQSIDEDTNQQNLQENYYAGLSKSTIAKRKAHFKKYAEKPGDGPDKQSNYKPAPGDARAKTKTSKHTLKFRQMYGENDMQDLAKKRIDREKQADKIKHDRMMDRARMRDAIRKNKETK